ncbi:MAG TPA: nuclear transport factor 2 family protein [Solirubrobacteraceae bacterium]|nr:nuclear transport factor 2 family protein [Solirubrobacteraceae bacterium]
MSTAEATSTAARFRAAVERKDLAAAGELLAPDVVFHSPVTFHPFLGRETVSRLLGEVIQVFTDFRYTDELAMDGAHALIFRAGVAGTDREIEGIDLLRFQDGRADGPIVDFTVMLRPLSALVPFAQQMGERAQAAGLQTTRA